MRRLLIMSTWLLSLKAFTTRKTFFLVAGQCSLREAQRLVHHCFLSKNDDTWKRLLLLLLLLLYVNAYIPHNELPALFSYSHLKL